MGRQYLQLAQRLGQPRAAVPDLDRLVGRPGRLPRGRRADRRPDARGDRAGPAAPRAWKGPCTCSAARSTRPASRRPTCKKAVEEYGRAFANGQDATPAVELRLAQIEVMLGRPADALKRIDWLVSKGKAGPAAENLAVLTLQELKRDDEARKRLDAARAKYPREQRAGRPRRRAPGQGEAARGGRPAPGRRSWPGSPTTSRPSSMRAQILAQDLDRPAEARKLLADVADRGDNSAPLVQLALLELAGQGLRRRRRLDRQGPPPLEGRRHRRPARRPARPGQERPDRRLRLLRRRPEEGPEQQGRPVLEGPARRPGRPRGRRQGLRDRSPRATRSRRSTTGLSLATASQSALAGLAMENGDLDSAIARYREMLKDGSAAGDRPADPLAARRRPGRPRRSGPPPGPRSTSLLADPKAPPTAEERVRAATYYRINKRGRAGPGPLPTRSSRPTRPTPGPSSPGPRSSPGPASSPRRSRRSPKAIEAATAGRQEGPGRPLPDDWPPSSRSPRRSTKAGARRALAVLDRGPRAGPRLGRAGPGQVPDPDRAPRGAKAAVGVRRGEGQGRPQGARTAGCS